MSGLDVREMEESRRAAAVPCRNIVRRRVSQSAYLRAVQTEGTHVTTAEGEAWWRDQERKYPFICAGGNRPEGTSSPDGSVNSMGRVSRRYTVKDGWMRREKGKWVKENTTKKNRRTA